MEEQREEVEVLLSIFEESITISPSEPNSIRLTFPGLHVAFYLPENYPMCEPPSWEIFTPRLSNEERQEINSQLQQMFFPGSAVIFQWIEYLRERFEKIELISPPITDFPTNNAECVPEFVENMREEFIIIHGEPFTDRKSTFQAHIVPVTSQDQVHCFVAQLLQDRKVAKATHNIMAFRIFNTERRTYIKDCDDDGETAAGGRLLHMLDCMDAINIAVVVSRYNLFDYLVC